MYEELDFGEQARWHDRVTGSPPNPLHRSPNSLYCGFLSLAEGHGNKAQGKMILIKKKMYHQKSRWPLAKRGQHPWMAMGPLKVIWHQI